MKHQPLVRTLLDNFWISWYNNGVCNSVNPTIGREDPGFPVGVGVEVVRPNPTGERCTSDVGVFRCNVCQYGQIGSGWRAGGPPMIRNETQN